MKFSTKDRDNDQNGGKCATARQGGWWYKSCTWVNLNGLFAGSRKSNKSYCTWYKYDSWYSLKSTDMKVRRQ